MKKKILSIVLTLAMVLSLMPMALAESNDEDSTETTTSTVTTLPDAVDSVIKLTGNVALAAPYVVTSGTSITLDLNGYSITRGEENAISYLIGVASGGSLTVQDSSSSASGKIDSANFQGTDEDGNSVTYAGWGILTNGDVIIESGTVSGYYGVYASGNAADATLSGGSVTGTQIGVLVNAGAQFTMNDGTVQASYAVKVDNGAYSDRQTVANISGGTITGTNTGIEISANKAGLTEGETVESKTSYPVTVTVSGDAKISAQWGITLWGKGAELAVNGGTIEGSSFAICGNGTYSEKENDSGTKITITNGTITSTGESGTGIYHPQDGEMTISGGMISGATGIEIRAGELNVSGNAVIKGTGTSLVQSANGGGTTTIGAGIAVVQHTTKLPINVVIEGGEISGYIAVDEANTQNNSNDDIAKVNISIIDGKFESTNTGENVQVVYSQNKTGFITGGTFSSDVKDYVSSDKGTAIDSDGNYIILPASDVENLPTDSEGNKYTDAAAAEANNEAKIGDTYYATLQAAITAANDGNTVTLLDDITVESGTAEQNSAAIIINKAITLDGNGKSITAASDFGNTNIINVVNSGEVTIKNLTVNGTPNSVYGINSRHDINIYSAAGTNSKSVVTLENVITTGGLSGVTIGSSDVTIKGDATNIANGTWYAINLDSNSNPDDASLTVEEGTIGNIYIENSSGTKDVKAEIKGGNIENVGISTSANSEKTSAEISGGTFSNSVAEYVIKTLNYELNSNGTYTYYETLEEALKDAQPGDKITALNADIDNGESDKPIEVVTVTYQNGNKVSTEKVLAGDIVTLPSLRNDGYNYFRGWTDGAGNFYKGGSTVTINANTIFTAQWTYIHPTTPTKPSTPTDPTYAVNAPAVSHGAVTVSPETAAKGDAVTITVRPDEGYELDSLIVFDAVNKVPLTQVGDTKFTFTMPGSSVTVSAAFSAVKQEPAPWTNPYTDVAEGVWYYDAVQYVTEHGLMGGADREDTFQPAMTTTRGMIMTILARMNGVNTEGGSIWYEKGMNWAVAAGVSDGTNPGGSITRQELVTMLWRYVGEPASSQSLSGYPDASATASWAADAMRWAVENGIITQTGEGLLNPAGTASRAEVATILMRFCENIVNK